MGEGTMAEIGICGLCDGSIDETDETVKGEEVPELGGRLGSLAHLRCVSERHADMAEAHQQYRFEVRGMENPPTFEEWMADTDFPEDILSFLLHEGGTITLATLVQEFIADEDEREMEAKIESALVGLVGEGTVQQVAPSAWRANTEYIAYCEEQSREYEERGELAGSPREMGCFTCHLEAGNPPEMDESKIVQRKVVKLGPVVNPADPTQSYELECGHRMI